jgi:hypothetical protein
LPVEAGSGNIGAPLARAGRPAQLKSGHGIPKIGGGRRAGERGSSRLPPHKPEPGRAPRRKHMVDEALGGH